MNLIDAVINYIDPVKGLKRTQARAAQSIVERNYDFASQGRRNKGFRRKNTSASQEVSAASSVGAATGQELCRNNPLALRAKQVWQCSIVGGGIQADLTGDSKRKVEKLNKAFDKWAKSTDCDFEGHYNLYGLQWLWAGTVVESGGVFLRRHINKDKNFPLQIQTIEQEYLDRSKNGYTDKGSIVDGIQYDGNGQIEGYWLFMGKVPKDAVRFPKSKFHRANNIIHIFRKDRAGQHLGVTWFGAVVTSLDNYGTYVDTKVMQQQVAACFGVIIEGAENPSGVGGDGTREMPDSLEPGMIEYTKAGQKVYTVSPPKADDSSKFDINLKRDIAAGMGITYEQLTGDYSQVNFASGRMGKSEFYNMLDYAQKLMFRPALDKLFGWFLPLYEIKNSTSVECEVDWTFPPRATVNPQEEFDVLMSKVRHGMLSPQKAAKILGERLEKIIEQWRHAKKLFGELPFDIDPSIFAATGNQVMDKSKPSSSKQDSNANTNSKG